MSPQATTLAQDQRNVLQMLQKSIASELDLGKELCDTRYVVEQLKMNLYQADQQSYFLEESVEAIYQRMLSAENASQLFLETSKDLLAKINTIQFYSSASVPGNPVLSNDGMSSMEKIPADNANHEAVLMKTPSLPELSNLQDKIQQLEECLRGSASQPQWSSLPRGANQEDQDMTRSEITTVRDIINEIKFAISKAESRAQNAEARCTQLTQTNDQLYAELNSDRAGILEKRLKESGTQLEHAKASVDAVVEQQGMLKASMSDMEQMIEDLKEKFCKAETRAENAESKCKLLTDTNLELSEELSFLRGRVEGLENSLRQANQLKVFTAKDIDVKTKTISDLVAKLALERERLHLQV
jgi:predicted  nucleic acid-binding Zn-ribbon protein